MNTLSAVAPGIMPGGCYPKTGVTPSMTMKAAREQLAEMQEKYPFEEELVVGYGERKLYYNDKAERFCIDRDFADEPSLKADAKDTNLTFRGMVTLLDKAKRDGGKHYDDARFSTYKQGGSTFFIFGHDFKPGAVHDERTYVVKADGTMISEMRARGM